MCLSAIAYFLAHSSWRQHKSWTQIRSYRNMRKVTNPDTTVDETGWNVIEIVLMYNVLSWRLIWLAGWWRRSAGFETVQGPKCEEMLAISSTNNAGRKINRRKEIVLFKRNGRLQISSIPLDTQCRDIAFSHFLYISNTLNNSLW